MKERKAWGYLSPFFLCFWPSLCDDMVFGAMAATFKWWGETWPIYKAHNSHSRRASWANDISKISWHVVGFKNPSFPLLLLCPHIPNTLSPRSLLVCSWKTHLSRCNPGQSHMCYLHMICQNLCVIGFCLQNLISGYLILMLKLRYTGGSFPLPPSIHLATLPSQLAALPWQVGCRRSLRGEEMLDERGNGPGMGRFAFITRGAAWV